MTDLIVKSKIKAAVSDMSVSGDVADALNKRLLDVLDAAANRAKLNGRRTLQSKDVFVGKTKNLANELVVKSKVKAAVSDLSVSGDVPHALNHVVHGLLEDAAARAKLNSRKTVQARDL